MKTSVSSEGALVFWTSRRTSRAVVQKAYDAEGLGSLVPKIDHYAALTTTAAQIVEACGLRTAGRVKYGGLAHDRNAVGVEIRRLVKGKTKNDLPFLMSLGAVEDGNGGYEIAVLEADAKLCPDVVANQKQVEQAATAVWQDCCDYITANDMTNAIVALVKRQHGVLLRDGGVVWYLTEDKLGPYLNISSALAPYGPKLHAAMFNPVVNTALVNHVASELDRRCTEVFERIVSQKQELQQRGAKARKNGEQSRLEEWIETESTLQHMRSALGRPFANVCKAADAARRAIGAEGVRMMKTSA
jgi:hypothetical protein